MLKESHFPLENKNEYDIISVLRSKYEKLFYYPWDIWTQQRNRF